MITSVSFICRTAETSHVVLTPNVKLDVRTAIVLATTIHSKRGSAHIFAMTRKTFLLLIKKSTALCRYESMERLISDHNSRGLHLLVGVG